MDKILVCLIFGEIEVFIFFVLMMLEISSELEDFCGLRKLEYIVIVEVRRISSCMLVGFEIKGEKFSYIIDYIWYK